MKYALIIPLLAASWSLSSLAESRIYRCGNSYTNNAAEAQAKGCKLVEGGNVTVVEGVRVNPSNSAASGGAGAAGGSGAVRVAAAPPRANDGEQRARDSDMRAILEAELKKAEEKQAQLLNEYNKGEPEKQGAEMRNNQKYLDRIAELKASIARNESDIAGIKRELGRVPAK